MCSCTYCTIIIFTTVPRRHRSRTPSERERIGQTYPTPNTTGTLGHKCCEELRSHFGLRRFGSNLCKQQFPSQPAVGKSALGCRLTNLPSPLAPAPCPLIAPECAPLAADGCLREGFYEEQPKWQSSSQRWPKFVRPQQCSWP
jgi:hypothetical protein